MDAVPPRLPPPPATLLGLSFSAALPACREPIVGEWTLFRLDGYAWPRVQVYSYDYYGYSYECTTVYGYSLEVEKDFDTVLVYYQRVSGNGYCGEGYSYVRPGDVEIETKRKEYRIEVAGGLALDCDVEDGKDQLDCTEDGTGARWEFERKD
jgi:hypothetical protein